MTVSPRLQKAAAHVVPLLRGVVRPGPPGRRVIVPTVLQMEAVECGAASLAMILAYHGSWIPLEELRVACGVSRDGSKASNMLRAAQGYGLVAKGYRKEPGQLRDIALPAILHWNFNHFVVLEGFRNGEAYLKDPARGPTRVSEEEFDQSFTGVVLVFEPGPGFRAGGARRGLLSALSPRLAHSHSGLLYIFLAGLALVAPGIVGPSFARVFVDSVLVKGLLSWMRPLLILMGITALVQGLLLWLQQHYLLRLETRLALNTSGAFFWHVLRLPMRFFTQRYAGEIGNRVGINDRVARLLSGEVAINVLNTLLIVFYAVLMIQYDLALTTIGVLTAALNMAALKYMARKRVDLNQRLLQDRGKLVGVAMGGLQTIETLKATGSESDFFTRWSGHQAKAVNAEQEMGLATRLLSAVPPFLLAVDTTLILGFGGLRVIEGRMTMGMLLAFQGLVLAFINPVNRLVNLGSVLQEAKGDLGRLDDVLRAELDPHASMLVEPPAADAADGERPLAKLAGHLELREVTFGYSPLEPPLIQGFSLDLRPGSRVALVGGSGSGKSTIAKLVAGLYEPWSGEIRFDGRPRAAIPRAVLTNSVAIVDQDIFLLEDSVRENLTLWDDTIPEASVLEAARDACIHDAITARAGGYASRLEEGGTNYSGGERQRLEIARALAANPSVLVLDEPTSALDAATEKEIDDSLRRRGCTCLLVAHRLSTIRDCDEIIVLDRGRIVQRGAHEALIDVAGPYRELIAAE